MKDDELYFFAESIDCARELPFTDCMKFLSGMASAIDRAHPYRPYLTHLISQLRAGDAQLDLIQLGQLKLDQSQQPEKR